MLILQALYFLFIEYLGKIWTFFDSRIKKEIVYKEIYHITRKIFFLWFSLSFIFFLYFYLKGLVIVCQLNFFSADFYSINLFLYFDIYFFLFARVVFFISAQVITFNRYYIWEDKNGIRYIIILSAFTYSIIVFIITPNLVTIFLGWDGLGVISYILVIHYCNRDSLNSGILTILSNRIGDISLIFSVWLSSITIGSWSFIFWDEIDFILIFLIILTAFTKRAQIPFSSWLPYAIAAPTPVSSLVHSSTLVTAGVFLLFRFHYLIDSFCLYLIYSRGIVTILLSGVCGIFETDLKKVIALSTLSQLGLIIVILGSGYKEICFFHLLIHAIFKSRIFISMGLKIHQSRGLQDRRFLSFNWKNPLLGFCFGVTNLSLTGFPFISGFYSKDFRLELRIIDSNIYIIDLSLGLRVGLTIGYRLKFIISGNIINRYFNSINELKGTPVKVVQRLSILILFRIFLGYFYFKLLYNDIFIIDIYSGQKFIILSFIFLTVFLLLTRLIKKDFKNRFYNILNKNYYYRNLFFLSELTVYVKKFIKDIQYFTKILDMGWLEYSRVSFTKISLLNIYKFSENKIWGTYFRLRVIFFLLIFFIIF